VQKQGKRQTNVRAFYLRVTRGDFQLKGQERPGEHFIVLDLHEIATRTEHSSNYELL
jgi:hypothetical protein